MTSIEKIRKNRFYFLLLKDLLYLLPMVVLIAILSGSASAFFLWSLDEVTQLRNNQPELIFTLPLLGLLIGLLYHYLGKGSHRGNSLVVETYQRGYGPPIPFRMGPLVLFTTLLTHLGGGSAGREGTAVQMAASIADQWKRFFRLKPRTRRIIMASAISAGFASVFGTPLAGAVFALEMPRSGKTNYETLFPAFVSGYIAHVVCLLWGATHSHYHIGALHALPFWSMLWVVPAGIAFGFTARAFSLTMETIKHQWEAWFKYAPIRPLVGGVVLMGFFSFPMFAPYMGLGLPTIQASFVETLGWEVFALKLLFTAFTLGVGFRGGEVTPLFFIGASLGSALSGIVPLPTDLLAGLGFVAVFAGATNTPIACLLMGIELFGAEAGPFLGIACVTAYLFSGHTSIYANQEIGLRMGGKG